MGKPEYPGEKHPLVGCSETPIILILMRASLPSKLRKIKQPKHNNNNKGEREGERETHTQTHACACTHTLTHNHTRAYTHYCSSMVGYSEGIGGSGMKRRKGKKARLFNSIFTATYGLNRHYRTALEKCTHLYDNT